MRKEELYLKDILAAINYIRQFVENIKQEEFPGTKGEASRYRLERYFRYEKHPDS